MFLFPYSLPFFFVISFCLSLCCATCYTLRRFQSKYLHSQFGPYLIWQHAFRFVFFFGVSRFLHFASFCFYVDSIYLCHSMHGNKNKFLKLIVDCFFYTYSLYLRRINSSLGSTVKSEWRNLKFFFNKTKKLLMFD